MDGDLQGMILAKLTSIEQTIGQTAVSVARLEERVNSSMNDTSDHEGRIRSLEHWRWSVVGAMLASGTSLGVTLFGAVKGGA